MSKKDTKPNIKRVIADTFGTGPGLIISTAIAAAVSFGTIPGMLDTKTTAPDNIGTAMEESITARHQANFAALQEMKSQIDLLEAETAFTDGSQELTDLKTAFGKQTVSTYMDLYLEGASNEGAALSEQNFEKLRTEFAETIANPADFGFQENITASMLDETLATTDLNMQDGTDRFETAKQLDQQLATALEEETAKKDNAFTAPLVASVASFLLLFMLTSFVDEKWGYEPRRVPRRKPKKTGPYGGH
ncbi:MAG: hypothetical protein HND56_09505 [Pseudomonadota bacterium]|nr:hypothetical protein [Pseudomonadota bacterium]QKK05907.1 MAG: hypothetical protein HND56_09505 [Pseudomonadota bacterium]